MRHLGTSLALTAVIVTLTGCSATTPTRDTPTSARIVAENVTYARSRVLDVYMAVPAPDVNVPVVIMLHGCCGDRADLVKLAEATAAEGAAVFNVDWGGFDPDGRFPQSYEEVACAVRFARANAELYGADPERVALLGWSDGALVGAVVTYAEDIFSAERCVVPDQSSRPGAFVGVNGFYGWTLPVDNIYVNPRTVRFFGGTPTEQPEAWSNATPYMWLDRQPDIPSVLLVGAKDSLRQNAERFDAALRDASKPSRLLILPPTGDQTLKSPRTEEGRTVARETAAAARDS